MQNPQHQDINRVISDFRVHMFQIPEQIFATRCSQLTMVSFNVMGTQVTLSSLKCKMKLHFMFKVA